MSEYITEKKNEQKRKFNNYVKLKVEKVVISLTKKLTTKIKAKTHDPHMYKPVQNLIDDTVEVKL